MDRGTSTSSTGTRVKEFIESTPHVLEGRRLHANPEYQSHLKYHANPDFEGDDLAMVASVPNTFHHKKGSPARTKDSIGAAVVEETSHIINEEPPITTSTIRGKRPSLADLTQQPPPQFNIADSTHSSEKVIGGDKTADWMPTELDEKWVTDDGADGDDGGDEAPLNLALGDTMIIKSIEAETPQWKLARQQYEHGQKEKFNELFAKDDDDELTLLTILAANNDDSVVEDGSTGRGQYRFPQQLAVQGSPLKLYNNEYDTFTKKKLDGCIQQIKMLVSRKLGESPPVPQATPLQKGPTPTPQQSAPIVAASAPEKSTKQPADYMKNGNDLLRRIQGRGYPGNHNAHPSISNLMTTATLTPKPKRTTTDFDNDGDMLWTSLDSYDNDDNDGTVEGARRDTMATMDMINDMSHSRHDDEYTDLDAAPMHLQNEIIYEEEEDDDQYTNDSLEYDHYTGSEVTTQVAAPMPIQAPKHTAPITPDTEDFPVEADSTKELIMNRMDRLESVFRLWDPSGLAKSIQNLASHVQRLESKTGNGIVTWDNAEVLTEFTPADLDEISRIIQFKRRLQLSLRPQNTQKHELNLGKAHKERNIKNIPPGSYVTTVGDMHFDSSKQLWIGAPQETVLDQIEDLQSDTETIAAMQPLAMRKLRRRGGLEVLFVDGPDDGDVLPVLSNVLRVLSRHNAGEVTRISQIGDTLYVQTRQRLAAVISDVLADDDNAEDLRKNKRINLSSFQLDNVKELDEILPELKILDLSKNRLVFLEGINADIKDLNVLENMLSNLTSFNHLTKLYRLNVAKNLILGLGGLSNCDTLLILNIAGNKLTSLKGVEHLLCLTELNCLHNLIGGEVNCSKLKLPNLIRLKLLNNQITSMTSINELPKLVVLNLNDNNLTNITCDKKHTNLKKLELKFNQIRRLNLLPYPHLRVLRIDGNNLGVSEFRRLGNLEELLAKSQPNPNIIELVVKGACDVRMLDLSGNQFFDIILYSRHFERGVQANLFKNLNKLVLIAMDLSKIPPSFANMFPNVRLLNLNFNRLTDISGLSELQNLKKLYLVSNEIPRVKVIRSGLTGARKVLKVLDVRLNPCTVDMYPYVFSPDELKDNNTVIPLDRPDDIDNFVIHYDTINRDGEQEWSRRDADFIRRLGTTQAKRNKYELYMLAYFSQLRKLDGTTVSPGRRNELMEGRELGSI